jgi:hypothetical protein
MSQACPPELSLVPIVPIVRRCARTFDDCVRAPGWFDSSWDLRSGLEVREGWLGDDGVNGWIEGFLRAQRSCDFTASPSSSTAIA